MTQDTDKHPGGRPGGSLNKPKKTAELLQMLEKAAAKEGKKFTYSVDDGSDAEKQAAATAAGRKQFESLDLELDQEETTNYKCGSCGGELSGEIDVCPHCGEALTW